ncbi:Protein CBG26549 [Caenorhabditis briggsae]|uniref:Protein CBG26549 n=1 Tax=Caenorhabditis briggsae TaxID=6238 RepID=B6IK48_CAEBR|nr:Protein CBG26549 [Caenorhabditis briggsae]CAS00278.1 Protein CBG26549 [Caenorhabditis briggsae]
MSSEDEEDDMHDDAAGVAKNQNFDYSDIEKFQTTVFAAKLQIIAIVKDQATPYFASPYVGKKNDRHISRAGGWS